MTAEAHQPMLRSSTLIAAMRVFGMGLSFAYYWIFIRLYGHDRLGEFSILLGVAYLVLILGNAGMPNALVRHLGMRETSGVDPTALHRRVIGLILMASIPCGIVIALLAPVLAIHVFEKPVLQTGFFLIGICLPIFSWHALHLEGLNGLRRPISSQGLESVLPVTINTILLFSLFSLHDRFGLLVPIFAQIIALALAAIGSTIWFFRNRPPASQVPASPTPSRQALLKLGMPMMMTAGMFLLMGWVDVLILGAHRNSEEVGVYRMTMKLATLITLALYAVNRWAAPRFSAHATDPAALKALANRAAQLVFWGTLPFVIGVLLLPQLLLMWFEADTPEARLTLRILAGSFFYSAACGSLGVILEMTGYEKENRNIIFCGMLLNVVLNLLLIPRYGMTGAAIATGVSLFVWNTLGAMQVVKRHGFWPGYVPFRSYSSD